MRRFSFPCFSSLGDSYISLVSSVGASPLTEPSLLKTSRALSEAHSSVICQQHLLTPPGQSFLVHHSISDVFCEHQVYTSHCRCDASTDTPPRRLSCNVHTELRFTHVCVHTHRAILSPLPLVSVNGTTIYSAHPDTCMSS